MRRIALQPWLVPSHVDGDAHEKVYQTVPPRAPSSASTTARASPSSVPCRIRQEFPDLRITVEEAVGEGDLVAQGVHLRGHPHRGVQGFRPPEARSDSPALGSTASSKDGSRVPVGRPYASSTALPGRRASPAVATARPNPSTQEAAQKRLTSSENERQHPSLLTTHLELTATWLVNSEAITPLHRVPALGLLELAL